MPLPSLVGHLQQELREKAEDRDNLASVVEALKLEIDRCQSQLDEDSKAQQAQQKESDELVAQLRKELDDERKQNKLSVDELTDTFEESERRALETQRQESDATPRRV